MVVPKARVEQSKAPVLERVERGRRVVAESR